MVVICSGHPAAVLARMNSVIRRIDLSCKLLAPVLSGFVISFVSTQASAVVLALWNVASVGLEYWMFTSVYRGVPALGENVQQRRESSAEAVDEEVHRVEGLTKQMSILLPCWESWAVYMRQEVMLPGLAMSILYFGVLRYVIDPEFLTHQNLK